MAYGLEDFENIQVLSKTPERTLLRVTNLADQVTYLLKSINREYPKPKDFAKINHEYLILKKIKDNKGVIKVIELKEMKNNIGLLMEDIAFDTLSDYLQRKPIHINEFLNIAIKLSEILGKLHAQDIINRNLKPDNILYNPTTKEIKLLDFELASELAHDYQPSKVINSLEGTLAYISPEQTGRMNRPVTSSTDLYSMGVIFYQMLTGRLPFEETNAVSLVFAHIAKVPVSPHKLNHEIPQIISEIIMKLLSKKAEDRYKTAFGLQADLIKCQEIFQQDKAIGSIKIGENDFSHKFEIPDKLYGRDEEIKYVLLAFDNMYKESTSKLLLVYGYSGIGKTSLINEVHKPIVQKNGLFIDGKIDQYHRDQPYFSLTQAFNKLIELWFSESNEVLDAWRNKIRSELGDVVQVIIDLVPLLGKLITNPPKLAELTPLEAKNRLHLTLLKFIKILTEGKTPLVLFIDDAQWASSTLLDLLEYLIKTEELKNLMIVIGYRDNEVLAGHPVLLFIDEVEKIKSINKINLRPLKKESVNEMIRDTLGYSRERANELTEIVYKKTEGNPFFLKEILQDLYTKNLLKFSRSTNTWEYDSKSISEQVNISDNVVDFMIKRLQTFSDEIQKVMNLSACIGNTFNLDDVANVLKQDKNIIAKSIWLTVKEGMILPVSGDYEHAHEMEIVNEDPNSKIVYKFQHDRIQQASYQLATNEENKKSHYEIGKSLAIKYGEQSEKYALEIASQLNKALDLVISKEERNDLMYLNYYAGENMFSSSAYAAAIEYFLISKSLLPENHWSSLYDFTSKLYKSLAKAFFSRTEFEKAEELMDTLINNSKTFLERMSITNLKAVLYSTVGKRNISIPLAIKGLNEMGVSISEHPSKLSIAIAKWQIKWYLGKREIPSLLNDPEVTDPAKILIAEFLYLVTQDAMFIGNPPLLQLSNMKLVTFSIKYGNFRATTIAYAMYAGAVLGPTEASRQFAELSVGVLEKLNAVEHKCKTYHWYAMFCLTFHSWWGRKREFYMKSIKYGLETGDIRYLAYAIDHTTPFDPTFTISEAIEFDKGYAITLKETGYREIICLRNTYNHYLLSLSGKTKNRLSMSDSHFDELENVKEMTDLYFYLGPTLYHLMKSLLCFLYDEFDLSLQELNKIQVNVINAYYGCPDFMMYVVNKFLTYAALYDTLGNIEKKQALEVLSNEFARMSMLSKHCPDNYVFHFFGMAAEMARIDGKPWGDVIDLYDKAIQSAEQYRFMNFIGIYSERAAKFALQHNKRDLAISYFQKARYAYERWGATEKVKHLNEKYSELFPSQSVLESQGNKKEISHVRNFSEEVSLDYNTILMLSESLFKEKNIEKLIEKTLKILAENIGAQYCALMLLKDDDLVIEGIFDTLSNKLDVLSSLVISEDYVPVKLINYVFHSNQEVVIDDITKNAEYSQFPYVVSHPVKSVICVPIISHQDLVGIFYGEHRELTGTFTNERLEILRVLSGTIAISLENSRYLEHLQRLYEKTECFVPKAFLEILKIKNVEEVVLGDCVKKNISVLFNDIRGFTSVVEKRSPEDAFAFVNLYWQFIAPIIRKHHGYIDQLQGDGLLAIFPEKPEDALQASIAMMDALAEFNATQKYENDEPIRMGVGISTGPAMLGVIGEKGRHMAGLISDVANTAARVEGLNKLHGTRILLSGSSVSALASRPSNTLRKIDHVLLMGKFTSTEIYEVIDWASQLKGIGLDDYLTMFSEAFQKYYTGQFKEAVSVFKKCLIYFPEDKAASTLFARCVILEQKAPQNWDGTFTMTFK